MYPVKGCHRGVLAGVRSQDGGCRTVKFRIHTLEPASRANGPGLRAVVWFQGCTLGCPGCFNPLTHDPRGGEEADTAEVARRILSATETLEGITISGGEPFQQPEALLSILERLTGSGGLPKCGAGASAACAAAAVEPRSPSFGSPRLSTLVFTGYSTEEIRSSALGPRILALVDVLVAGRYVAAQRLARELVGSANQRVHFLTGRYGPADLEDIPVGEMIVREDGSVAITGIAGAADLGQGKQLSVLGEQLSARAPNDSAASSGSC